MYEDQYSNGDSSSEVSVYQRGRGMSKVTKLVSDSDPSFFKINRKGQYGVKMSIGLFSSGIQGTTIRNAVTGARYSGCLVGSQAEDLYFKVALCTGETKMERPTLFYENPEQYERHMHTTVSESTKKYWFNKMIAAQTRLVK
jgi:hypothetical protein